MAFNATNFALMAQAQSGASVPIRIWGYRTSDAIGAGAGQVQEAGYFAAVGSTSGSGIISDGDAIFAVCNGDLYILEVTDAAAGTCAKSLNPA